MLWFTKQRVHGIYYQPVTIETRVSEACIQFHISFRLSVDMNCCWHSFQANCTVMCIVYVLSILRYRKMKVWNLTVMKLQKIGWRM